MSVLYGLTASVPLAAQDGDPFAPATNGFLKFFIALLSLAKTLMVIGGLFSAVVLAIRLIKGDKDGAKNMIVWVVGLAAGFVFLLVLSVIVQKAAKL